MEPRVTDLGALILFTGNLESAVQFYAAIGIDLEPERHEDSAEHFACELGQTHFAIFESGLGSAPEFRSAGSSLLGFTVNVLEEALEAARSIKAAVIQEPTEYPWGRRALLMDPDGRVIELFQRPQVG